MAACINIWRTKQEQSVMDIVDCSFDQIFCDQVVQGRSYLRYFKSNKKLVIVWVENLAVGLVLDH